MSEPANEADRPLEPDEPTARAWMEALQERLVQYLRSLPEQPAGYDEATAADRARGLVEPEAPENGRELE
ncbi:MAG: hypothetical protein KDB53_04045, partial [Planctomycetes bacterium]|nr:hypothetical protein [Planctomycetota bacterium]